MRRPYENHSNPTADATGVYMRPVVFYFKHKIEDNPREFQKMNELRQHVADFRHSSALIRENEINNNIGVQDAYTHLAPMVDTDTYMAWLLNQVQR